jgi:hypothetical protein
MVDIPLLGLTPGNPQNHLSGAARRRVARAHLESERIRWDAVALIDAKGIERDGKAAQYKINQANLKAAKVVLRVLHEEYSKLGMPIREFWECMNQEIEGAVNSLELLDSQKRLLEIEFFYPMEFGSSAIPKVAKKAALQPEPKPTRTETSGTQLNRLRAECRLTIEQLAEKVGIT